MTEYLCISWYTRTKNYAKISYEDYEHLMELGCSNSEIIDHCWCEADALWEDSAENLPETMEVDE